MPAMGSEVPLSLGSVSVTALLTVGSETLGGPPASAQEPAL